MHPVWEYSLLNKSAFVNLYSRQQVNLSNIFCFNVLSRAEIGSWQWLSRHPSPSRWALQMNCSKMELTKICIFLLGIHISALCFYVHFHFSVAIFSPNREIFLNHWLLMPRLSKSASSLLQLACEHLVKPILAKIVAFLLLLDQEDSLKIIRIHLMKYVVVKHKKTFFFS